MKKSFLLILVLVLAFVLCACGKTQAEAHAPEVIKLPEGASILGIDMAGLTTEEAFAKLEAAAAGYQMELKIDDVIIPITANDIGLSCSREDFIAAAEAIAKNEPADLSRVIRYNDGKFRLILSRNCKKDPVSASISFDEAAGQYVLNPHTDGLWADMGTISDATRDAFRTLAPQHTLTGMTEILRPAMSADAPEAQAALELANKMIGTKLTYTFADKTYEIPAETIRSFVTLGSDGFTPSVNEEALDTFASEMSDTYSIPGTTGPFQTTGGGTVGLTVSYNGRYIDKEALKTDIITCLQDGISGTREAAYEASGNQNLPYGGTYIEINLNSQHLWFYKNGTLMASTNIVSGTVAADWCTPNGVFAIYSKSANTYLVGDDYRCFVNYWMPFYGAYGLHDATYRGSFASNDYLYNGSHGCVNMPLNPASIVFNNAPVGTKVIIYGGATSVKPAAQSFTGTTSYDVAEDVGTVKLNIKPKNSSPKMTYSSSNPSVATVNESGVVTIKGIGTAKITVSVPRHKIYDEAKTTVTINVHSTCDEGRHDMGKAVTVKEPTCQPGLEKATCKKCGHEVESELKATQSHSYGDWTTTKEPTCSAEGAKERTCTKCKTQKETGTVPATGAHTEGSWVTTKEPTCVAEGSREMKCSVCGSTIHTETLAATGVHTPGEWKVEQDATCSAEGVKQRFCIHCDTLFDTGTIPMKEHPFGGAAACPNCGTGNPNYVPPTDPEEGTGE